MLEQLNAYRAMIPLMEEMTEEQKAAKSEIVKLFNATEAGLKKNSRFGNRAVEGFKANLPSITGIVSALFARSPLVGAVVNFALEKYQEKRQKREEAQKQAAEDMLEAAREFYERQAAAQQAEREAEEELIKKRFNATKDESNARKRAIEEAKVQIQEGSSPLKVPNAAQIAELKDDPEFHLGIAEGMLEELQTLNDDQIEDLRESLAALFQVEKGEFATLEDIRDGILRASSEEAELEAERQMKEQTEVMKDIRDSLKGRSGDEKKPGGCMFAGLLGNMDLTDIWAGWAMIKGGLASLGRGLLAIGGRIIAFSTRLVKGILGRLVSLPVIIAAGFGKGLYDGIKNYLDTGNIGESMLKVLTSAGDFFLFGFSEEIAAYFSEKFGAVIEPVFKAYDFLVDLSATAMENLVDGAKKIWSIVTDPVGSAMAVYDTLRSGMTALFEEAANFVQDPLGYARNLFEKGKESIRGFFVELIPSWVPDRFLPEAIRADVQKYRGKNSPDLNTDNSGIVWMDSDESYRAAGEMAQVTPGFGATGPSTRRALSGRRQEAAKQESTSPAPAATVSTQSPTSPIGKGDHESALIQSLAQQGITDPTEVANVMADKQESTSPAPVATVSTQSPTSPIGKGDHESALIQSLAQQGITDPTEVANVMAQVKAESNFVPQSENLNYSPETLFRLFGKGNSMGNKARVESIDHARSITSQGPEAVGNLIYGDRMGNNGEGFKYRGRGLIQLTGRENYEKYGKRLGIDLVNNPDQANRPEIAAQIAGLYFGDKKKAGVDLGNINSVGKAVGYATGAEETAKRAALANQYKAELAQTNQPSAELGIGAVQPRAEMAVEGLTAAAGNVKQAELVSRAKVESRTAQVNVNNSSVVQQSATPTGGTSRPENLDPTIGLMKPVLT
ncbi:MAG: hypothetical protein DA330_09915 [Nitrososphaera sp.]|nr:hypothetical protein [Nitrososphaera sp.]